MEKKFKLTLLAVTMSLVLSACSTDESQTEGEVTPPTGNAIPVIQVINGNQVSLNENEEALVVSYNILDADHSESELKVSYEVTGIEESELKGSLDFNETDKTITYTVGNIQEEESFSIVMNVEDPEGESASEDTLSSRTVSVQVLNNINEAPTVEISTGEVDEDNNIILNVAGNSSHTLNIPFTVADSDGDELTYSIGTLSGLEGEVKFNEDNTAIIVELEETYVLDLEGRFDIAIYDGQETTSVNFKVLLAPTQVSPTLEVVMNKDGSGNIVSFEVEEGQSLSISFNVDDLNEDEVFVSAVLTDEVATYEQTVVGNKIDLTDFNVEEDMSIKLTITATDATGTVDVVQTVAINVTSCADCAFVEALDKQSSLLSMHNSISSRDDEKKLLNFYTDYLSLTEQLTDEEVATYKTNINNSMLAEKKSIESKISALNVEFDKVKSDEGLKIDQSFVENLNVLMNALEISINTYGNSGITMLNELAQIDSKLPTLDLSAKVNLVSSVDYSRYVGNNDYGYSQTEIVWKFLNEYEILEVINVLSGECK
jgi:hypothetical protein